MVALILYFGFNKIKKENSIFLQYIEDIKNPISGYSLIIRGLPSKNLSKEYDKDLKRFFEDKYGKGIIEKCLWNRDIKNLIKILRDIERYKKMKSIIQNYQEYEAQRQKKDINDPSIKKLYPKPLTKYFGCKKGKKKSINKAKHKSYRIIRKT